MIIDTCAGIRVGDLELQKAIDTDIDRLVREKRATPEKVKAIIDRRMTLKWNQEHPDEQLPVPDIRI